MANSNKQIRPDFKIIANWIKPGSKVLDLGCGDGTLLHHLAAKKKVKGYGLEIDDAKIPACIKNGVNVIQTNLDQGLAEFQDHSFDYVILSLTLQAMRYPAHLIKDMLRVGTVGIVTFPNFGHWKTRWQLAIKGQMPISKTLPHRWHDTPNIHLCTTRDFDQLCYNENIDILEKRAVNHAHQSSLGLKLLPNLLGEIALYRFSRTIS